VPDATTAIAQSGLIIYLAKRLLLTDRDEPFLFDDRLNDLSVAVWEYERDNGRIQTDIPEEPDRG